MSVDKVAICAGPVLSLAGSSGAIRDLPERPDDGCLHVGRRYARDRTGVLPSALKQGGGHVITVPGRALLAGAGGHAIAAVIEDSARQQRGIIDPMLATSLGTRGQLALDRLEQFPVDDRRVLAGIVPPLVDDFADVNPVLEQIGQRSLG